MSEHSIKESLQWWSLSRWCWHNWTTPGKMSWVDLLISHTRVHPDRLAVRAKDVRRTCRRFMQFEQERYGHRRSSRTDNTDMSAQRFCLPLGKKKSPVDTELMSFLNKDTAQSSRRKANAPLKVGRERGQVATFRGKKDTRPANKQTFILGMFYLG